MSPACLKNRRHVHDTLTLFPQSGASAVILSTIGAFKVAFCGNEIGAARDQASTAVSVMHTGTEVHRGGCMEAGEHAWTPKSVITPSPKRVTDPWSDGESEEGQLRQCLLRA